MDILEKLSYGQYIITAVSDAEDSSSEGQNHIAAATVNWLTQTSFKPPMIAIVIKNDSDLHDTIENRKEFTAHVLGRGQENLINEFARDSDITDKTINGIPYKTDKNGQIILDGAVGYLTCEIAEIISAGDHTLYLSRVINQVALTNEEPLTTQKVKIQYAE